MDDLRIARKAKGAPAPAAAAVPAGVSAAATASPPAEVGKYVLAQFPPDEQWYYGKLIKAEGKDFVVKWDEPDENEPESKVGVDSMVVLPEPAAGDKVKCVWEEDGSWHDGTLVKSNGDGTFVVSYNEDGSEATLGPEKRAGESIASTLGALVDRVHVSSGMQHVL
ncbi:unnamed protein product [Prorocentrum cordatum]|uniref:Tudor domain-containing protein n=1 Tax=Prorocentrum cordatum TaxID=2364126 RepID=A0ABN9YAC0_9DINO|nr:unnamed protein product [Polarella glacialis]